ncbi:MAG: hypothetical protein A2Z04_07045 [Chloroflexi bacterium RBG_16_57_9]|nr:MAG: hypothetical protein A2Z04_07045 [Chloroflexi bacterium RBG_16_57_9]
MISHPVDLLNRQYRQPYHRFNVITDDGVTIQGVHLSNDQKPIFSEKKGFSPATLPGTLFIYCHGFLSGKNHRVVPHFVEALAERGDAMSFDFRGHGESHGTCTFADREVLDLKAVVRYARGLGYERIVTIGSSMGGATVIRYAALFGDVDGVVTIGAFADGRSFWWLSSQQAVQFFFGTSWGAQLCWWTRGTRVGSMSRMEQPIEVVHRIAPRPLLLIQGEWDLLIHPSEAEAIYQNAREPKELVIVPRGGHDLPLLTESTRDLIVEWVKRNVILL